MVIPKSQKDNYLFLLEEFYQDIPFFAKRVFGSDLSPIQVEFVEKFRSNRLITFRGGVGFGKTHALCILIWWALINHDDVQVTVMGPNEAQIKGGIWKELEILYERMLIPELKRGFTVRAEKVYRNREPAKCFAEFRLANKDNIASTRGIHQINNFVIVDEATGVDEIVFTDSLINILTDPNPKLCLISNPSSSSGYFYRTWNDPSISGSWAKIHGRMSDNPRLTPEAFEQMAKQYGGPTTNRYRVMVEGEFPLDDEDGVIPRWLVEEAVRNTHAMPSDVAPLIWGVDPAGRGKDNSVLIARRDNIIVGDPMSWNGLDTSQLAHKINDLYKNLKPHERPKVIAVDANGIGRGVVDRLNEFGVPVQIVMSQSRPTRKPDFYHLLRDQLWWEMREWFQDQNPSIPNHPRLIEELCNPRYSDPKGKVKVESKDDMKKRLRGSPDFADALACTFAVHTETYTGKYAWHNQIDYGNMQWAE